MERVPFHRRFRALCLLQFLIQRRRYLQNLCLLAFPLVVLTLPVFASLIAFSERMVQHQGGLPKPERQLRDGTWFYVIKSEYDCCNALVHTRPMACKLSEYSENFISGNVDDYYIADHTPSGDDHIGQAALEQGNGTQFLRFMPRLKQKRYYLDRNQFKEVCGHAPAFNAGNVTDAVDMISTMLEASLDYFNCSGDPTEYPTTRQWGCITPQFVGHGVIVNRLKSKELKLESTIVSDQPHMAWRNLMSGMIQKIIQPTGNVTYSPRVGKWKSVDTPSRFSASVFADISILFLYPIVAVFLMPMFASALIEDRNLGVLQFMELYGVTAFDETLVRCIFDMALFLVYMFTNHLFGAVCQIIIFQFSWWMLFLVNPLFGYIQLMAAYSIAPIFKEPGQVTVLGYLVLLISCCVGALLNLLLFTAKDLPPWWYLIFPPFTYIRCIALAIFNYNQYGYIPPGISQFFICLGIMVVQALLLTVTASGSITLLLKRVYYFGIGMFHRASHSDDKTSLLSNLHSSPGGTSEDEEVHRERVRITNGEYTDDDVLVIQGLRKEFGRGKRKKVAVNDLYFSAKRGSCTGLIGANGSGKTTTTNMITGYLRPTSGTAFVCGYDISTQIHQVKKCIGVLPQFEVLFPNVTVEEHILFFSRLRGISSKQEIQHVKDILSDIGLEEARRRFAKNLSGGMRRRLGLAIALSGSPPLLLLDEPSSGLDAASARGMWDLILEAKKSRCVILTSHSMHEVETLCERIGMIANGDLVCAGDLIDLKMKYSDGFKLKVTCEEHNEERVKSYVKRALPFAEFVQKIAAGNLLYRIKSQAMKLSVLFSNMQPMKISQCGIKDWSLDEGGILETIFMRFAAGHDDEAA